MEKIRLNPVKVPWKISASEEVALFNYENDRLEIHCIADLFDSSQSKEVGDESGFFDHISIVQLRLILRQSYILNIQGRKNVHSG